MQLVAHLLQFLVAALGIVVMGAFYSHSDDGEALRSVPKRYGVFVASCLGVVAVMLVVQWIWV